MHNLADFSIPFRLCALSFVLLLQLWVGWTFMSSQMERESEGSQAPKTVNAPKAGGMYLHDQFSQ